mgnify:CR=1 FL=1
MTEFKETELDERAIKMAKVLSADAVEKAGSGHPGSPISLAPVAYTAVPALHSSTIRMIPTGKAEIASSFPVATPPSPSTSSCTSPATA